MLTKTNSTSRTLRSYRQVKNSASIFKLSASSTNILNLRNPGSTSVVTIQYLLVRCARLLFRFGLFRFISFLSLCIRTLNLSNNDLLFNSLLTNDDADMRMIV